jgi:hypothetical protein
LLLRSVLNVLTRQEHTSDGKKQPEADNDCAEESVPPGWILPTSRESAVHFVEPYKDGTAKPDDGKADSDETEPNSESS